jgi:hypothetical protein
MPASAEPAAETGERLAVLAESLYLANLLLLPLLAFLALGWLFLRMDDQTPPLARAHLQQAFAASLWGGMLLVVVSLLILGLGGHDQGAPWTLVILYFTTIHATFVLVGIIGLAKAMAGRCWRVPLIGPRLPPDCPT